MQLVSPRVFWGGTAIILVMLILFPSFAEAAVTYSRSQLGTEVTTPFTITISAENFSDYGLTEGVDLYYITLDDDVNPRTECFPVTQLDASATFDVTVGDLVKGVMIVGFTGFCESGDEPYYLEGDGSEVAFTVIGADHDFDTVFDENDNCPLDANAIQENNDGDEAGDVCDPDDDNDGAPDTATETEEGVTPADNCPFTVNAAQEDADSDGFGDACDDTPLPPAPPPPPPSGSSGAGGVPPQCANGSDDDADGKADFGNDGGCDSSDDNDESGDGAPPATLGEVLGASTEVPEATEGTEEVTASTASTSAESTAPSLPSEGEVLGAATIAESPPAPTCSAYLTLHLRRGKANDPEQVKLLQTFLNEELNAGLPVTGFFGPLTEDAVKRFQVKHKAEILQPWIDAGFGDASMNSSGTGYVYKTTLRAINMMKCPAQNEPMPELVPDAS